MFTIYVVVLSLAVAPIVAKLSSLFVSDFLRYLEHGKAVPRAIEERQPINEMALVGTLIAAAWAGFAATYCTGYACAIAGALFGGLVPAFVVGVLGVLYWICTDGWSKFWRLLDRCYLTAKRRCGIPF